MLDEIDKQLLGMLQEDVSVPLASMADRISLSKTPCWNRVRRLQRKGVVVRRVALLAPTLLNLRMTVFVEARLKVDSPVSAQVLSDTIQGIPEIVECHRVGVDADYLMKVVVPDMDNFNGVYKLLNARVALVCLKVSIAQKTTKCTTALPLHYAV